VFVVGGGGVIAGYTETLAKELGLAKERVAIRGKEVMQNIQFENEGAQKDSMMVTPIGICLSYYEQNNNFIFVQFNEEQVKLYDNGKLMVVDAAIAAGFPNEDLFPKRGKCLVYTVDGKNKMQRGLPGEAAVITVNGKESDIHSKIVNGDKIVVTPSTAGEDGKVKLDKLSQLHEKVKIIVNGNEILLDKSVKVNGNNMLSSYEIQDNDVIEVIGYYTVEQIAQLADVILDETMTILVNDVPAKPDTKVYHDFSVSFVKNTTSSEAQTFEEYVQMSENEVNTAEADTVQMPEETIVEAKVEQTVSVVNEQKEEELPQNIQTQDDVTVVLVNKQPVVMRGKSEYIFVDVFDYIQFDLRESGGRNIVTLLNGRQAQYMETIKEGDIIDIYWEN